MELLINAMLRAEVSAEHQCENIHSYDQGYVVLVSISLMIFIVRCGGLCGK